MTTLLESLNNRIHSLIRYIQHMQLLDRFKYHILALAGLLLIYILCKIPFVHEHMQSVLSLVFFTSLFILWGISVNNRIVNNNCRQHLLVVTISMILWLLLRFTVQSLSNTDIEALRYLVYLYAIPMTAIPLMLFYSSLYIGKEDTAHKDHSYNKLIIPGVLIILLFITNDLHQFAYAYPNGVDFWNTDYTHGFVWYIQVLWVIVLTGTSIYNILQKCSWPITYRYIWILAVPIVWAITCLSFYSADAYHVLESTDIICLMYIGIIEVLIQLRLYRVNIYYDRFFENLKLPAAIVDDDGTLIYGTHLHETRYRERRSPIKGGYFIWYEDVSAITELSNELESVATKLSQNNDILSQELKITKKHEQYSTKNKIFDEIAVTCRPQIEMIQRLLDDPGNLAYCCVYNAYIKRISNLMLLRHEKKSSSIMELEYSIRESMDYLKLCDCGCSLNLKGSYFYPIDLIIQSYMDFEKIIECIYQHESFIPVTIICDENGFTMRFMIEDANFHALNQALKNMPNCSSIMENCIIYVTLSYTTGGGQNGKY